MSKKSLLVAIVILAVAGLMAWVVREPASAQQPPVAQRWEYKVASLSGVAPAALEDGLNKLGADGWEICTTQRDRAAGAMDVVIFKRPRGGAGR